MSVKWEVWYERDDGSYKVLSVHRLQREAIAAASSIIECFDGFKSKYPDLRAKAVYRAPVGIRRVEVPR